MKGDAAAWAAYVRDSRRADGPGQFTDYGVDADGDLTRRKDGQRVKDRAATRGRDRAEKRGGKRGS